MLLPMTLFTFKRLVKTSSQRKKKLIEMFIQKCTTQTETRKQTSSFRFILKFPMEIFSTNHMGYNLI